MAIEDEAGRQPILGELVPDVVRVARDQGMCPVAEMGGPARPGIDRGPNLVAIAGVWPTDATTPSATIARM